MTGPEHYTEAERLSSEAATAQNNAEPTRSMNLLAAAQVHATLALAAATAMAAWNDGSDNPSSIMSDGDFKEWAQVAGAN